MKNLSLFFNHLIMSALDVKKIRTDNGLSQEEFAKRLGVNIRTVQNYEQGAKITPAMIKLIEYEFLSESDSSSFHESEGIYNAKPVDGMKMVMQVPLVHQYAYAGYLSGFSDPEYLEDLPVEPVMVDSVPRGKYMAFEVRGDSMDDGTIRSYPARCKVVGREIQKHHWRDKLHIHKWNFIIVHRTDGILLKQIKKHDVNTGVLTLHSFNELYEDFEINLDDVIQIFNVVKKTMEES